MSFWRVSIRTLCSPAIVVLEQATQPILSNQEMKAMGEPAT